MRLRAVPLSKTFDPVFDTCGTGGDRSHTFNVSTVVGAGRGGIGSARRQTRQPVRLQPVRQRGSLRGARREHQRRSGCRRAVPRGSGHRFLPRADIPSFDAPCGADSERARRSHGVQSARPFDEPRGRFTSARRRTSPGADGTGRTFAGSARIGTSVGGARCGRSRRDLDDRLHKDFGMPGRIGQHVLPPSVRRANPEGVIRNATGRRTRTPTRKLPGTFWPARPAHRGTSFCSTQARRCSLLAPQAASRTVSSGQRTHSTPDVRLTCWRRSFASRTRHRR